LAFYLNNDIFLLVKSWRRENRFITFMAHNKNTMNKNIPEFGGFPTDNSSSTALKYDIIASKFIVGIENHHRRNSPVPSFSAWLGFIGTILQGLIIITVVLGLGIKWVLKKINARASYQTQGKSSITF